MSSGGGSEQETTPWGPQQPFLKQLYRRAGDISQDPYSYFPGQSVADRDSSIETGLIG